MNVDSFQIASFAASVGTTIAAVAVVVTAVIYYGQLRAMKNARQLDSILAIIKHRREDGCGWGFEGAHECS